MNKLKQKLTQFKLFIQQTFRAYPHAYLLFGFIVLTFIVSLANDAYFGDLFKTTQLQTRPPEIIKPTYMTVLSVEPESGIKQSFDTFMQFTVLFSDAIDPASVQVTTVPSHSVGHSVTGNKIRVFPRTPWKFEVGYEITIQAKATSGLALEEPYVYNMYLATPTDSSVYDVF